MNTEKNKMKRESLFYGRLDELCRRALEGEISATDFLTPEELVDGERYLRHASGLICRRVGGYPDAERCMIALVPDYYPDDAFSDDDFIRAVRISSSGYAELSHRSFLGALTSLGIDRSAVGDILITEGGGTVFVTPPIADFLLSSETPLCRVGADKVSVTPAPLSELADYRRSFTETAITVASPRLDAIVSELAHTSRERAKETISDGDVSLNHVCDLEVSKPVSTGDTLSVRRVGKFKIGEMSPTKKGRVRVVVLVYD